MTEANRWWCTKCKQVEDCSCGVAPRLEAIKEIFDSTAGFKFHKIPLPLENLMQRKSGVIYNPFIANYRFGVENGIDYLEIYYDPMIAPLSLMRISAGGTLKIADLPDDNAVIETAKRMGLYLM